MRRLVLESLVASAGGAPPSTRGASVCQQHKLSRAAVHRTSACQTLLYISDFEDASITGWIAAEILLGIAGLLPVILDAREIVACHCWFIMFIA